MSSFHHKVDTLAPVQKRRNYSSYLSATRKIIDDDKGDYMTTAHAPNKTPLTVKPRRMVFPYASLKTKNFFDDNLLKSAYMAAMSSTFPGGEGEFIDSVRLFRDQVEDEDLKQQIRGFIGQEGHHSHQHKQFNVALQKLGFDAVRLEKSFDKDLQRTIKDLSPEQRLAFTVSFEHQTAILAEEFLTNPQLLDGMDDVFKQLMLWHSVEEIEHKSVAFDLYMHCVGDRKLLKKMQRKAVFMFSFRVSKYMMFLMWWSRSLPKWSDIKGFAKFLFAKNGLIRNLRKPYKDYFRDDFHPWDNQNQHLIDQWKSNNIDDGKAAA